MTDRMHWEVCFRRQMGQNEMMLCADGAQEACYETRMLKNNDVRGLLKFAVRRIDDKCWFCYQITSRQPLSRLLETQTLTADSIRTILGGMLKTFQGLGEYLLSEEQILLEPDFVYIDLDDWVPKLCLVPGKAGDFPREFSQLLQYLLEKTDHRDKEGVALIYSLYRESLKENYGLEGMLETLSCFGEGKKKEMAAERKEAAEVRPESSQAAFLPASGPVVESVKREKERTWFSDLLAFFHQGRKRKESDEKREDAPPAWAMIFEEEQEKEASKISEIHEISGEEDDVHTTLLWSRTDTEDHRRLISTDGRNGTIEIRYYPFLIGKQENLSDYVLKWDTVSRLHIRLDKEGAVCRLTDLNSTNGTAVNGRRLEANETVELKSGDEVLIADQRFRFQ